MFLFAEERREKDGSKSDSKLRWCTWIRKANEWGKGDCMGLACLSLLGQPGLKRVYQLGALPHRDRRRFVGIRHPSKLFSAPSPAARALVRSDNMDWGTGEGEAGPVRRGEIDERCERRS